MKPEDYLAEMQPYTPMVYKGEAVRQIEIDPETRQHDTLMDLDEETMPNWRR